MNAAKKMLTDEQHAWCDAARKLKTARDEADAVFMEFLYQGEVRGIHTSGYTGFVDFLEQTSLCKPVVYDQWRAGRVVLDSATAERVGCRVTILAGRAHKESVSLVKDVVREADKFRASNVVLPGRQATERIADKLRIPSASPAYPPRLVIPAKPELLKLREENVLLRAKNAELVAENEKLKKAIEEYKKLVGVHEAPPKPKDTRGHR